MNEAVIKNKLRELSRTMFRSPKVQGASKSSSAEGIYISELGQGNSSIDESLEMLGLQVKYMIFDLEATRRENHYLRQMLESRPRPDGPPDTQGGPRDP